MVMAPSPGVARTPVDQRTKQAWGSSLLLLHLTNFGINHRGLEGDQPAPVP